MKHYPALVLVLLFGFGCSSTDRPTTAPWDRTSIISGVISLRDFLDRAITDKTEISVRLVGTSFDTSADSLGQWLFKNVPVGHYTIEISKKGFYTSRDTVTVAEKTYYSYKTILRTLAPYRPVLDLVAMPVDMDTLGVVGSLFAHTSFRDSSFIGISVELILGRSPALDIIDFKRHVYDGSLIYSFDRGKDSTFNMTIPLDYYFFAEKGFKSGDTIFFKLVPLLNSHRGFNATLDAAIAQSFIDHGSNVLSAILE